MDYNVRAGDRDELVRELRQYASDRERHGKIERAENARHAAQLLEDGEESAYFERIFYTVGPPDRWTVTRGTREDLATELREAAEGWDHFGKPRLAAEARRAVEQLQQGTDTVRAGHIVYEVLA